MSATGQSQRRVGVFWDVENCSIPSRMPVGMAASRLRSAIAHFGKLIELNVYGDTSRGIDGSLKKWADLRKFGVNVIHTPHGGMKQVADMRIIADIVAFALDHSEPATVILISCDGDFAHAMSIIQERGHSVWIISRDLQTSGKLSSRADGMMSWRYDVLERETPIEAPYSTAGCTDDDEEVDGKENEFRSGSSATSFRSSAFANGFGQAPPACSLSISSCQTSSLSFCAATPPFAIQTCFAPAAQSSSLYPPYGPTSVITSSPIFSSCPTMTHPPQWRFFPLIKVLRELRASESNAETPKVPNILEVLQILEERDPSVFRECKRRKTYLSKAQAAGVIFLSKEAKGRPRLVHLHPDYY